MTRAKSNNSKFLLNGVSLHKTTHSQAKGIKKKVKKEVHKAQNSYETDYKSDISPRNTKKAFFKTREKEIRKAIADKKKRQTGHRSHGTTPGEIIGQPSSPRNVHIEGKRWLKNIAKQIKDKSKKLTKHLIKKSYR